VSGNYNRKKNHPPMKIHFNKFFENKTGRILLSIILGLGVASLFRQVCKDSNCLLFKAPPLKEIKDKIYKHDGKCYQYEMKAAKCDTEGGKKIVGF